MDTNREAILKAREKQIDIELQEELIEIEDEYTAKNMLSSGPYARATARAAMKAQLKKDRVRAQLELGEKTKKDKEGEENTRLEKELKDIENQLANVDKRMIQASKDTARGFNFVARARERFATPDIKIKRDIFMGLGLHLTLKDKIVEFDSPKYLIKIAEMKKEAQIIAERVAPDKELAMKAQFEEKYASIPTVLRGQELRLTCEIMSLTCTVHYPAYSNIITV